MSETILDACASPALFQSWFKDATTWAAWFTFLRVLFGLELSDNDRALFQRCTGRTVARDGGYTEAWLVVGRRGGKSLILALIAVFLACFKNWAPYLVPGERGTVMILAADRRQARTIFRYVTAFLRVVPPPPAQQALIERETADAIDLVNGITIEILAASFRSVRGYTLIAALCDEIAFWRSDESANPDAEIINAIKPAMATVPGAMLLTASSPYAKRGVLYKTFAKHFGKDNSPALVWRTDTKTMNPTVADAVIADAYEDDPVSAAAEFGGEFRNDINGFLDRELIDAAVDPGVVVRPPLKVLRYSAFGDPSGGRGDSFTVAIAHAEGNIAILDCLYEKRAPFDPIAVVDEIAALLRSYGLADMTGDRYSASWCSETCARAGIGYHPAEHDRSALYLNSLPLFTSGRVRLIDNARLVAQLANLERRTSRIGRDRVNHPPGGADDCANSVAGALTLVATDGNPLSALMQRALTDKVAPLFPVGAAA